MSSQSDENNNKQDTDMSVEPEQYSAYFERMSKAVVTTIDSAATEEQKQFARAVESAMLTWIHPSLLADNPEYAAILQEGKTAQALQKATKFMEDHPELVSQITSNYELNKTDLQASANDADRISTMKFCCENFLPYISTEGEISRAFNKYTFAPDKYFVSAAQQKVFKRFTDEAGSASPSMIDDVSNSIREMMDLALRDVTAMFPEANNSAKNIASIVSGVTNFGENFTDEDKAAKLLGDLIFLPLGSLYGQSRYTPKSLQDTLYQRFNNAFTDAINKLPRQKSTEHASYFETLQAAIQTSSVDKNFVMNNVIEVMAEFVFLNNYEKGDFKKDGLKKDIQEIFSLNLSPQHALLFVETLCAQTQYNLNARDAFYAVISNIITSGDAEKTQLLSAFATLVASESNDTSKMIVAQFLNIGAALELARHLPNGDRESPAGTHAVREQTKAYKKNFLASLDTPGLRDAQIPAEEYIERQIRKNLSQCDQSSEEVKGMLAILDSNASFLAKIQLIGGIAAIKDSHTGRLTTALTTTGRLFSKLASLNTVEKEEDINAAVSRILPSSEKRNRQENILRESGKNPESGGFPVYLDRWVKFAMKTDTPIPLNLGWEGPAPSEEDKKKCEETIKNIETPSLKKAVEKSYNQVCAKAAAQQRVQKNSSSEHDGDVLLQAMHVELPNNLVVLIKICSNDQDPYQEVAKAKINEIMAADAATIGSSFMKNLSALASSRSVVYSVLPMQQHPLVKIVGKKYPSDADFIVALARVSQEVSEKSGTSPAGDQRFDRICQAVNGVFNPSVQRGVVQNQESNSSKAATQHEPGSPQALRAAINEAGTSRIPVAPRETANYDSGHKARF